MNGSGSNDTMIGLAGNDQIDGGNGADDIIELLKEMILLLAEDRTIVW